MAFRRGLPLLIALLVLAGCGSSDGDGGGTTTAASAPPVATAAAAPPTATTATTAAAASSSALHAVRLQVPAGEDADPFGTPRTVQLPSGWTASVWARLDGPRLALWTPQHTLLVSSHSAGAVLELTPGATPAAPATVRVLARGLNLPQGLAFDTVGGRRVLYVAEANQVDRYDWTGNGKLGARTVVIPDLPSEDPDGDDNHQPKSIIVGPGHRIIVSIGSADNASPPKDTTPVRASIAEYTSGGRFVRLLATGVRNGEGLSYAPDRTLWASVNERDQIAYPFHRAYGGQADAYGQVIKSYVNEHPVEQVARITAGRNLGWPYCDPDPDASKDRSDPLADVPFTKDAQTNPDGAALECGTLPPIERGIPAHSAPIGLSFLTTSTLPAAWRAGAALAVHGSWDRTPPRPPAVLWMPWDASGKTLGPAQTLMGGFQAADGSRWGRPVDAVPGPDGALYVTDDSAGAVYRLVPPAG